jgi:hypothetical protein
VFTTTPNISLRLTDAIAGGGVTNQFHVSQNTDTGHLPEGMNVVGSCHGLLRYGILKNLGLVDRMETGLSGEYLYVGTVEYS